MMVHRIFRNYKLTFSPSEYPQARADAKDQRKVVTFQHSASPLVVHLPLTGGISFCSNPLNRKITTHNLLGKKQRACSAVKMYNYTSWMDF